MLAIGLKSFSIQNVFLHRKKDLLVIIIIQVWVSIEKNIKTGLTEMINRS